MNHTLLSRICIGFGSNVILVEDNGVGFAPSDESSPHTALSNIRQRLEMMCGGTMTILLRDDGSTVERLGTVLGRPEPSPIVSVVSVWSIS